MNYRQIICTTLLTMMAFTLFGQQGARNERIESLKVAFITEKLNFTPDESASFWPLYNEMEDKIKDAKQRPTVRARNIKSEAEAKDFILDRFKNEQEALAIKRDYYLKFIEKVSAQKVMKLNQVENQFKRELLKEVRNRKGQRKNR